MLIFTFQVSERMGRLKDMVAVTTKIVSKIESIIRISLEDVSSLSFSLRVSILLPECSFQLQIVVF